MEREQIVGAIIPETEKLSYDGKDPQRIHDVIEKLTYSTMSLIGRASEFRDEIQKEADEDSIKRMKTTRADLVEAYATALFELHRVGAVFRISGDAFDRLTEYLKGPAEAPLVMAGL